MTSIVVDSGFLELIALRATISSELHSIKLSVTNLTLVLLIYQNCIDIISINLSTNNNFLLFL